MADPEPTIILQDLFHIRSRLKAAHMDILAVANRISILDAQFGNPPTHTLIVLAQRLMNRIDLYLVRPSDYPLYPNDVDDPDPFPLPTHITDIVLGLPTLSEEYTSSVCHAFGDAMVVITGNIVTATEGLADVCDRMEWFAPGSSSTVAQFAGSIGSILTDMGAVVEELHEQGELTSHESG